jgi:hypothetical protein
LLRKFVPFCRFFQKSIKKTLKINRSINDFDDDDDDEDDEDVVVVFVKDG